MPAFVFDTHKAVRTLAAAGMEEPVAEAVVETMNGAVTEGVATKADIARLEGDIAAVKSDIARVEGNVVKLEGDIADVKSDVATTNSRLDVMKAEISSIKWVLGFLSTFVLLIAGRLFGVF